MEALKRPKSVLNDRYEGMRYVLENDDEQFY